VARPIAAGAWRGLGRFDCPLLAGYRLDEVMCDPITAFGGSPRARWFAQARQAWRKSCGKGPSDDAALGLDLTQRGTGAAALARDAGGGGGGGGAARAMLVGVKGAAAAECMAPSVERSRACSDGCVAVLRGTSTSFARRSWSLGRPSMCQGISLSAAAVAC